MVIWLTNNQKNNNKKDNNKKKVILSVNACPLLNIDNLRFTYCLLYYFLFCFQYEDFIQKMFFITSRGAAHLSYKHSDWEEVEEGAGAGGQWRGKRTKENGL